MDRTIALHESFHDKTVYLMSSGQAPDESYMHLMVDTFRKYLGCFRNVKEGGIVFAYGTDKPGDVESTPALEQAYEMGKSVI